MLNNEFARLKKEKDVDGHGENELMFGCLFASTKESDYAVAYADCGIILCKLVEPVNRAVLDGFSGLIVNTLADDPYYFGYFNDKMLAAMFVPIPIADRHSSEHVDWNKPVFLSDSLEYHKRECVQKLYRLVKYTYEWDHPSTFHPMCWKVGDVVLVLNEHGLMWYGGETVDYERGHARVVGDALYLMSASRKTKIKFLDETWCLDVGKIERLLENGEMYASAWEYTSSYVILDCGDKTAVGRKYSVVTNKLHCEVVLPQYIRKEQEKIIERAASIEARHKWEMEECLHEARQAQNEQDERDAERLGIDPSMYRSYLEQGGDEVWGDIDNWD